MEFGVIEIGRSTMGAGDTEKYHGRCCRIAGVWAYGNLRMGATIDFGRSRGLSAIAFPAGDPPFLRTGPVNVAHFRIRRAPGRKGRFIGTARRDYTAEGDPRYFATGRPWPSKQNGDVVLNPEALLATAPPNSKRRCVYSISDPLQRNRRIWVNLAII